MNKFDYIVNPTTGKKVNVNTRLGKNILLNYKNINQMGGLGLPFKKKATKETVVNEEPNTLEAEEKPKKKSLAKKIRQGARKKMADIQNKAAEFERKSPKAAKILKMATKGAAKAALGIVPGGKLIASGASAIGKVASKQIYKRSPGARNQWWKNHLSSGNWQRNRDKAVLEFDLLDHDDSGTINKEEFLLSIPGMHHPDSDEAQLLKDRLKEKEKLEKEGKTTVQSADEIHAQLNEEKKLLDESVQGQEEQQTEQTAGGKKRSSKRKYKKRSKSKSRAQRRRSKGKR
tara:strand:+ start:4070 stop:4933 length:864 start_codon:yes stop_codon:yes gene_type:complete